MSAAKIIFVQKAENVLYLRKFESQKMEKSKTLNFENSKCIELMNFE